MPAIAHKTSKNPSTHRNFALLAELPNLAIGFSSLETSDNSSFCASVRAWSNQVDCAPGLGLQVAAVVVVTADILSEFPRLANPKGKVNLGRTFSREVSTGGKPFSSTASPCVERFIVKFCYTVRIRIGLVICQILNQYD